MNESELGFLFIESKGTVSSTSNKPRQQLLCFRIFLQGVRSQTRKSRAITVNNALDTNMGKEVLKWPIPFIIFERTDKLIFLWLDDFQDGDKNTHCRVNKFIKNKTSKWKLLYICFINTSWPFKQFFPPNNSAKITWFYF